MIGNIDPRSPEVRQDGYPMLPLHLVSFTRLFANPLLRIVRQACRQAYIPSTWRVLLYYQVLVTQSSKGKCYIMYRGRVEQHLTLANKFTYLSPLFLNQYTVFIFA